MIVSSSRRARLLRARADEAAGVDVDDGERLGVVEDQVAARRQVDAAVQRRLDLLLDAERLHQRLALLVARDPLRHVRRGLLQIADDPLVRAVVVDEQPLEVAGEEVAHDAQRQLGLLVDQRRRLRVLRLRLDRLPEALQEVEVALDVLGGGALRGGADDHAALLRRDLLEDRLQAVALLVLDAPRDAEAVAVRHEDDEAAGQRDLGRQARALRLHRVLDRLDEHVLAALDQILDLPRALAALELGADDLVDVEEAVLLEADLDERGLHARQHVVDDAEVDVAGDRAALRPLEVDLGDLVVLEHGDALLARVDRDRAARASPSAAAPASAACAGGPARCGRAAACARASSARAARACRRRRSSLPRRSAVVPSAGFFLRLRPPRVPRRRFLGAVLDCPSSSAASSAAASSVSASTSRVSEAAAGGACSSDFLRRNQGNGKRSLLSHARAQPRRPKNRQGRARVAGGWEKPWHRPAFRVSTGVA